MQKYALVVLLVINATLAIPVSFQGSADNTDTPLSPFLPQKENIMTSLLDDSFEGVSGTAEEHTISEAIVNETKSQNQKDSVDEGEIDDRGLQTDSELASPQNTPSTEIEATEKAGFGENSSSLESGDPINRDNLTEASKVEESEEQSVENLLEDITNVTTSTKEQVTESSNNYEEKESTPLGLEDSKVIEEPTATENIEYEKLVEETAVESETVESASSEEGERSPTSQALESLSSEPSETEAEVRTNAPIEGIETEAPETEEVSDNSPVISGKVFELESEEGLENSSTEIGVDATFMEPKSKSQDSMTADEVTEIVNEENYDPVVEESADYTITGTEMSQNSSFSFVGEVISTEAPIEGTSPTMLIAVPSTSVKGEELEVGKDLENLSIESKEVTSEVNETESEFQDWVSVGEITEVVENTTITESSIEAKEFNVPSNEKVEGQEISLETSIRSISPDMLTTVLPDLTSLKNDAQVVVEAELKEFEGISLKISPESTEGVTTTKATPLSELQPIENETQVPTSTESDQSGINLENEDIISDENSDNELNQTETALPASEYEKSLGDSLELDPESEPTEVQTDISRKEISETSKQETIPEDHVQTEEQELVEETQQNRNPETVEEGSASGTTSDENAITTDRSEYAVKDEDAKTEITEGEPEISPQGDEQEPQETVVPSVPVESADDETVPLSASHPEPNDSTQPDSSDFGSFPALQGGEATSDIPTTSTSSVLRFSLSSAALLLFPQLFDRL
nr:expressed protein [Hymenolepis microstoma]